MPEKPKVTEEELKTTLGREWRREREQGRLETLPSGKVVRLNKIRLRDFMGHGNIPNPLMPVVVGMMGGNKWTPSTEEDIQLYFDLLDWVCTIAFREPKIVEKPEADNEISIVDVDMNDQLHVFNAAQQEIQFLTSFRPERVGDVAASQDSEDVSGDAERDDGGDG